MTTSINPQRIALLALGCLTIATASLAGDLDPPAGGIQPTLRTLQEIEPRIPIYDADMPLLITSPGSYFLAEPIVTHTSGIQIASNKVVLDLSGLRLTATGGYGIEVNFEEPTLGQNTVIIRNGLVTDCGDDGIYSANASGVIIEDIITSGNAGHGIFAGQAAIVRNCSAYDNEVHGFFTFVDATIDNSVARNNDIDGFNLGWGSTSRGCSAMLNGGDGFELKRSNTIEQCAAYNNGEIGIRLSENSSTVSNCTVQQNGGDGILGEAGNTISTCTAAENGENGILLTGDGNSVRDCTLRANADSGIVSEGSGFRVSGCVIEANEGSGIVVRRDSLVLNNTSTNHSSVSSIGILVTGSNNRIDGNHTTTNTKGLDVRATGNLIIRNTIAGTSVHFSLFGGNDNGPFIFLTGMGDLTGIANSSHPWANFVY